MTGPREKIIVPELLPAWEDGVFKSLLTRPEAKPVLRDLISSILQMTVMDVEVTVNELPVSGIDEKRSRLDVNCRLDGRRQANVEMVRPDRAFSNAA
jgi:hypothetical protein